MTDEAPPRRRVAIIGAGPSGLAQLCAFSSEKDMQLVCFEKQSNWGGLWNYSWRTGTDEYGNPCSNSMYRNLWSNGPKEGLEFSDYTFEQHFGSPIGSYPPRSVLLDYIEGRAKQYNVRSHIRFSTIVRDVRTCSGAFEVTSRNECTDVESTEVFDYVIVATGHFSVPNVPEFPGFANHNSGIRILHAHDFRDAREFTGANVLIVGSSYSAEDIGSQCWKYGAKSIVLSHRRSGPLGYKWPENWKEVPQLERISEGKTAYFIDGSSSTVDAIILCTGYKHHFPFLSDELRLKTTNRLATTNLYKGVVWNDNSALFYLGMQDQWYTFNMFDAQAWWVQGCIMGRIQLPNTKQDMIQDVVDRQAAEDAIVDDYGAIAYQGAYTKELMDEITTTDSNYPTFDVEATNVAFYEWKKSKRTGFMGFRDGGHTSPMTGTKSPAHHTKWKEALDDSLDTYLGN